jgi:hypothetical protein
MILGDSLNNQKYKMYDCLTKYAFSLNLKLTDELDSKTRNRITDELNTLNVIHRLNDALLTKMWN